MNGSAGFHRESLHLSCPAFGTDHVDNRQRQKTSNWLSNLELA